jgi:hypothetical protein
MKLFNKLFSIALIFFVSTMFATSQFAEIQNFTPRDKDGLNVFETPKDNSAPYTGRQIRIGGAFALQMQSISQKNDIAITDSTGLIELGSDFNLPTANLFIDVQLADGVRLNLDLYLASNHHHETWVKGGYLQIDKLDFISKGFLGGLMESTTIKVGQMENNYGDAHFRRSDNGAAFMNPFVGNLIMDAFVTEIGAEVYYQNSGFIGMLGFANAKLNQSVTSPETTTPAILAKVGYDKQINDDFRLRITGSVYHTAQARSIYLYHGDRTGSRFYNVIQSVGEDASYKAGRYAPSFKSKVTAMMFNNLIKYKGLELFSTFEMTTGGDGVSNDKDMAWTQFASELLYRFGTDDNLYGGIKYNMASGDDKNAIDETVSIDRIEAGLGWFMTRNILTKVIYVNQNYTDFAPTSSYAGANFNGITLEAVISF